MGSQGWRRLEIWEFSQVRKAWRCGRVASPGNTEQLERHYFSDDSSPSNNVALAPVVVSLVIPEGSGGVVGLAFADAVNFTFGLAEFPDNDLLGNVEAALIHLGAVECIVSSGTACLEKIKEIASNCGVALNTIKSGSAAGTTVEDLAKIIAEEGGDQFSMVEHPELGLRAAGALINYLDLLGSDGNLKAFHLQPYNPQSYLKLDDCACRSLHLFQSSPGIKTGSLLSLLDQCRTGQGSRLLGQWLRQPLREKGEIEGRQEVVGAFVAEAGMREALRERTGLGAMPDLARILKRLLRGSSNLQDIVVLYQTVQKIPSLLHSLSLSPHQCLLQRYTQPLTDLYESLAKYTEMVEGMLDFPALDRHEYIVRADFDPVLEEISREKESLLEQIEPEFERVAGLLGLEAGKKVKLEKSPVHGYAFRISRLDASLLETRSAGAESSFHQLSTQKNGVYFVTPLLREYSLRYDELSRSYASKQSTIVKEICQTAATYRPLFDRLNMYIADLDVCLALAWVAVMAPKGWVKPAVGGKDLVLIESRHPCLESFGDFIPNSVIFNRPESLDDPDSENKSIVQIITGPNMGGKSTYIRQAALCVILAQMGSCVPALSASLPIFDAVMVRVGAGDSILRGVSTFMAEMLETASILRTATPDSFVIIDELGRGTSTSEGLGLAWGVTKHIATQIGCFTFFATHFHELTVLASELPTLIKNLHVSAHLHQDEQDQQKLAMLYSVQPGPCDQSFGIHVAELAAFPPLVLQMARMRAAELEGSSVLPFASPEEADAAAAVISQALAQLQSITCPEQRREFVGQLASSAQTPKPIRDLLSAHL